MAIGLGRIADALKNNRFHFRKNIFYILSIPLTLILLSLEHDRLGSAFAVLLLLVFSIQTVYVLKRHKWFISCMTGLILLAISSVWILKEVTYENSAWHSLRIDAKVAIEVDRYDGWQTGAMPINDLGAQVNLSNYQRISWAIVGARLLSENPLGYGLLSLSFRALGKQIWPSAQLSWTHSGWLDFALGYGFPGVTLLLSAIVFTWRSANTLEAPWRQMVRWGLGMMAGVMCVKELSTEVTVNAMIFMTIWGAAMSLCPRSQGNLEKIYPN